MHYYIKNDLLQIIAKKCSYDNNIYKSSSLENIVNYKW